MKSIIEKTKQQFAKLEKVASHLSITNASDTNRPKVDVQVDTSDEANIDEGSDIFSGFNQSSEISSIKVDVQIDEDVDEDPSDSIVEGGEDTVFGQGTNPKPEDETYLNLLKQSTPKPKVKISIDKK